MCPVVAPLALASHLPVMLKPISVWRTMVMQTRAMGSSHYSSVSRWPLADGCLPWLLSCVPKCDAPRFWHVFTHVFSISSHPWLLYLLPWSLWISSSPSFSLCKLTCWEPITCFSLSPLTQLTPAQCRSSVQLGVYRLCGIGISHFLRWASFPLPASFSWSSSHSPQVRNSTRCPPKVLPAWEQQLIFPLHHPISSKSSWVPTFCVCVGCAESTCYFAFILLWYFCRNFPLPVFFLALPLNWYHFSQVVLGL